MRLRLLAAAAVVASCALALPGHTAAAPKPQIVDDAGDAVIPQDDLDILSGLFATSGTTAKVKGKTVYTPKKLEVTVTYSAPASTFPIATHGVTFDLSGCGRVYLQTYYLDTWAEAACIEGSLPVEVTAKGDALVYSIAMSSLGKTMKAGAKLTSLRVFSGGADPVVGIGPHDLEQSFVADEGTTSAAWTVK